MSAPALLGLVDAALRTHLSPALQAKLSALDALGVEKAGLEHAGALAVLLVAALVLLATLSFLSSAGSTGSGSQRARRGVANTIMLLGPCGAGKTAIFFKLLHDASPETVTSMRESEEPGSLTSEATGRAVAFRIVDFPGHERLRGEWRGRLEEGRLAGVVFVVDAAELSAQSVRPAGEFLYDILTDELMDNGPPVLVACHKADVQGAKAPARVKTLLTQELERLRKTRGTTDLGEESSHSVPLGRTGQTLNLDVDAPSELSFAATSLKDMAALETFIARAIEK